MRRMEGKLKALEWGMEWDGIGVSGMGLVGLWFGECEVCREYERAVLIIGRVKQLLSRIIRVSRFVFHISCLTSQRCYVFLTS